MRALVLAVMIPPLAVLAQDPPPEEEKGAPLLDFGRSELGGRLGVVFYSEDFEADPEFSGGAAFRVPSPWFSESVLGLEPDRVGAWLDLTLTSIDRDIDRLPDPDGVVFFAGAGADFTLVRDDLFTARAQVGAQYGFFGGVDDLDDGAALLLGGTASLKLEEHVWVTLQPQVGFADAGDRVYFLNLGLTIEF